MTYNVSHTIFVQLKLFFKISSLCYAYTKKIRTQYNMNQAVEMKNDRK